MGRVFREDHARDCQAIEELRRIRCEEKHRARQARIDELSMHQERNPTTVSQLMDQMRELQNKVNSLSDARTFYDPEPGSSSGATHVPDQSSTFLSPRTLPRCDSGLPRDTQKWYGYLLQETFWNDHLSSAIFNNSKNLASFSQRLRPDTTETARKERVKCKENR